MHKSEEVKTKALDIYEKLLARGVDVLLDDRNERAGVMFADSDLIGIPHRIVIGDKGLKNNIVEYKARSQDDKLEISLDDLDEFLNKI
mgnify:FL=1